MAIVRASTRMINYIALLRAVNLAGHQPVAMADLRELVQGLGFSDARTLLQSGNLVFGGRAQSTAAVEALLEAEAEKRLGLRTGFFVRTADEWKRIVDANPFATEAKSDPGHLLVVVLKGAVDAKHIKSLQQAIAGREVVKGGGREVYAVYPDGVGRSKLTTRRIEAKLETSVTARNWNTVVKLLGAVA